MNNRNIYLRLWRKQNPDKVKAANRRKYLRDKSNPEILAKRKLQKIKWDKNNQEKRRTYGRTYYRKVVNLVIDKLGGRCSNCLIEDRRVLCIDHINGGGIREIKSMSRSKYLSSILAMPNPENKYQILCHNCNWIKRYENKEISLWRSRK